MALLVLRGPARLAREPVQRGEFGVGGGRAAQVSGVADDGQFRVRPGTGQLPGGRQRAAQVEPAVDQRPRDAREPSRVPDELPSSSQAACAK